MDVPSSMYSIRRQTRVFPLGGRAGVWSFGPCGLKPMVPGRAISYGFVRWGFGGTRVHWIPVRREFWRRVGRLCILCEAPLCVGTAYRSFGGSVYRVRELIPVFPVVGLSSSPPRSWSISVHTPPFHSEEGLECSAIPLLLSRGLGRLQE